MTWKDLANHLVAMGGEPCGDDMAMALAFSDCDPESAPVRVGCAIQFPKAMRLSGGSAPYYYEELFMFATEELAQAALVTLKFLSPMVTEPVSAYGFSRTA